MRTRRFTKEDTAIVKLVAVLMMVFHHLFTFPGRIPESASYTTFFKIWGQPFEGVLAAFCRLCVASFLFLSGYGIYIQARKKIEPGSYVMRRIWGLWKPLWKVIWIFAPIAMLLGVKHTNPETVLETHYTPLNFILNMLGYMKGDHIFNSEWWFVTGFLFLLMFVPGILFWLKRKNSNFFSDMLVVVVFSFLTRNLLGKIWELPVMINFKDSGWMSTVNDIAELLPAFVMGFLFAKYQVFEYFRRKAASRPAVVLYLLSVTGILAIFLIRSSFGGKYDYFLVGFFAFAVSTLFRDIRPVRIFAGKMSKYITYVWLIHSFFFYQFMPDFIYSLPTPFLIWLFVTVLSFLSAAAVHWFWKIVYTGCEWICSLPRRKVV